MSRDWAWRPLQANRLRPEVSLFLGNNPECVDDARNKEKQAEDDVDHQIFPGALFQEDRDGRKEDGQYDQEDGHCFWGYGFWGPVGIQKETTGGSIF